jgi:hypothetical protein
MENEHTIAGLVRKRAEIAGQIDSAQTRVRQLMIDLDSVDGVLRLFDPEIDLADIKLKPLPPRHTAYRGEISRSVLTQLRETGLALTTRDITLRVMAEKEMAMNDRKLTLIFQKRVGACLRHLRGRGQVGSDREGFGFNVRWRLASASQNPGFPSPAA